MGRIDYLQDSREMLMHGLVLAAILIFWTIVSQLVGYGIQAANLNNAMAAGITGAIAQTGLVNALLYVLVVAVRIYKQ